jgi:hypothetical protein
MYLLCILTDGEILFTLMQFEDMQRDLKIASVKKTYIPYFQWP